jgi:hypothetical protein
VSTGVFNCEDPKGTVARVGALLDGLSVASLIYKSVNRKELQSWVRNTTADELGIPRAALNGTVNGARSAKPVNGRRRRS